MPIIKDRASYDRINIYMVEHARRVKSNYFKNGQE